MPVCLLPEVVSEGQRRGRSGVTLVKPDTVDPGHATEWEWTLSSSLSVSLPSVTCFVCLCSVWCASLGSCNYPCLSFRVRTPRGPLPPLRRPRPSLRALATGRLRRVRASPTPLARTRCPVQPPPPCAPTTAAMVACCAHIQRRCLRCACVGHVRCACPYVDLRVRVPCRCFGQHSALRAHHRGRAAGHGGGGH